MRCRKRDCPSPVPSLLVAAALLLWPAGLESATRGREDLVELISEIETAVWSRGEVERLDDIFDPSCVLHLGTSIQVEGTGPLKDMVEMFRAEFVDRDFAIDEIFASEDRVVERYRWNGRHARSGTPVSVTGCVVYHIENGRAVEAWNYEDMFSLYQQLGLVSAESLFSDAPQQ